MIISKCPNCKKCIKVNLKYNQKGRCPYCETEIMRANPNKTFFIDDEVNINWMHR